METRQVATVALARELAEWGRRGYGAGSELLDSLLDADKATIEGGYCGHPDSSPEVLPRVGRWAGRTEHGEFSIRERDRPFARIAITPSPRTDTVPLSRESAKALSAYLRFQWHAGVGIIMGQAVLTAWQEIESQLAGGRSVVDNLQAFVVWTDRRHPGHNANRRGSDGPCDCAECRGEGEPGACSICGYYGDPAEIEADTCPGCALVVCVECRQEHRLECWVPSWYSTHSAQDAQ